ARLLEVALVERVLVDDQRRAAFKLGQVRLERGRGHPDQNVRLVTRGQDVAGGEVNLERRNAGERAGRRPDLGREVRQRRQVIAHDRGRVREPAPHQLHSIPGVAREPNYYSLTLLNRLSHLVRPRFNRLPILRTGRDEVSPPARSAPRMGGWGAAARTEAPLNLVDVDGFGPLRGGLLLIGDLAALGERAVAVGRDARVVDEQVATTVVGGDEAEPLLVAEPFDCAIWHVECSSARSAATAECPGACTCLAPPGQSDGLTTWEGTGHGRSDVNRS